MPFAVSPGRAVGSRRRLFRPVQRAVRCRRDGAGSVPAAGLCALGRQGQQFQHRHRSRASPNSCRSSDGKSRPSGCWRISRVLCRRRSNASRRRVCMRSTSCCRARWAAAASPAPRIDPQGKAFGQMALEMTVEVPAGLVEPADRALADGRQAHACDDPVLTERTRRARSGSPSTAQTAATRSTTMSSAGIEAGIRRALAEDGVRAIVLTGAATGRSAPAATCSRAPLSFGRSVDEPTTDFGRLARFVPDDAAADGAPDQWRLRCRRDRADGAVRPRCRRRSCALRTARGAGRRLSRSGPGVLPAA